MTSSALPEPRPHPLRRAVSTVLSWIDCSAQPPADPADPRTDRVDWLRTLPFVFLHLGCLGVLLVGFSWTALAVCVGLYALRMFAITAFYHRYFAHRAFKTSRMLQFGFAFLANTSAQRGPLWWAAHHRRHHKHSDTERDAHSPHRHGFWWSHVWWFMTPRNFATDLAQVRDFARYPELRLLDRFDVVAPLILLAALFGLGELLAVWAPGLDTSGAQLVVWGFFLSTTLLFHGTCLINSLGHILGRRRYETGDHSKNSLLLAVLTLGEGWHNNHHFYPVAARQGFFWWEVDVTYYTLQGLAKLGLVWDLQPVPQHVRADKTRVPQRKVA